MQSESSLACSYLYFGYLLPKIVRLLFSLSLGLLVCMHARPLNYLDTLVLQEHMRHVHKCVLYMPDMMSLGFTYNVNHVIMMSVAFALHSCHIGIRWHDVIGVCFA